MYSVSVENEILKRELEIENNVLIQNIKNLKAQTQEKEKKINELEKNNKTLISNYNKLQNDYNFFKDEYNKIIYSRSYKFIMKIKSLIKRK